MKILTIVGGGILLAVGIVAGAQVLQLQQAVTIDFDRDICISSSSDKLPTENVHGYLDPNVPIEKPHWGEQEAQYWTELSRKISIHNSQHLTPRYIFVTGVSFQMNSRPYRGMASFVICSDGDVNQCRNRNFWFFKRISPRLLAQIVFDNSINKDTQIKNCPFKV